MEGQNVTQRGSLAERERQTSMQTGGHAATAYSSLHTLSTAAVSLPDCAYAEYFKQ